jgi:hypothetical protein
MIPLTQNVGILQMGFDTTGVKVAVASKGTSPCSRGRGYQLLRWLMVVDI